MEPASTASTKTARGFLWALFAVNVYRAATQSITADEAFTFNRFVRPPLKEMLKVYDANNHVLNTLLAKTFLKVLRLSEFTLRLPSVLCGGLYFWAVYRLARRAFGTGALLLAAVAALALNPLVLDHLSAARGYGMALAFWMWALVLLMEYLQDAPEGKLNLAGLCLGLSVASNLSFLVPSAALAFTFFIVQVLSPAGFRSARTSAFADRFLATGAVTACLLLALPLSHAARENFYYGAASLGETVRSLLSLSLYHTRAVFSRPSPEAVLNLLAPAALWGLAALTAIATAAGVRILRRREKGSADALLVLTAGVMAFTSMALVAAHRWWGVPYPLSRTALYFIPVAALACFALLQRTKARVFRAAALAAAGCAIAVYLLQFNTRMYGEWRGEVDSRELVRALERHAGNRPLRIGASASEEPVLNFYRERYRLRNWAPVDRKPLDNSFDFYVLAPADAGRAPQYGLRVLFRGRELVLAEPRR
jgi:4-amino-4-deoxy-L-arabinose transferase-like glycosyltransferase